MKKGDKIILLNEKRSTGADALLLNKIYTINEVFFLGSKNYYLITLIDEEGFYYSDNFITLKKYRKLKLNNINESNLY
jgi:hypothetical protein